jgi:hypothetical protein
VGPTCQLHLQPQPFLPSLETVAEISPTLKSIDYAIKSFLPCLYK